MKDFPVFTTENGAASLVLKEIPYRQEAYITLRDSRTPEALLEECAAFCRACGAEKVYATGHEILEDRPLHTVMLEMRGVPQVDETLIASLFPVTEPTVSRWRELHNQAMKHTANVGTLEGRDEAKLLEGGAYFVHRAGALLGIGWLRPWRSLLPPIPGLESMCCTPWPRSVPGCPCGWRWPPQMSGPLPCMRKSGLSR